MEKSLSERMDIMMNNIKGYLNLSNGQKQEHHVKLTDEEIWKFATLYNLSSPTGTYSEDPPVKYTRIEIYYKTGKAMILYVHPDGHFLLQPGDYEITGERLLDYIQKLMKVYG